jgi:two-component system NarL family sensor kinase
VVDIEVTLSLYLVWIGVAATLISMLLTRRTEEIEDLAESRGRLVAQALDSEDRERRRLAVALHDEAIQTLLAARHELTAGSEDGGSDLELVKLGLDRTVDQLRDAVFDLHPYVLEHAGLTPALEAFAERQARRGGFDWRVEVDPEAEGHADALLFSLARELITNAAKHAGAREVVVSVRLLGREVVLEVEDDGRGLDRRAAERAPLTGHIGLASCAERVEALDGRFTIGRGTRSGTRVRASLPTSRSASAAGAS